MMAGDGRKKKAVAPCCPPRKARMSRREALCIVRLTLVVSWCIDQAHLSCHS